MVFRKSAERTLFLTLWAMLLLFFGLWKFWLSPIPIEHDPPPPIEMGAELRYWFENAAVTETLPSHYSVELRLMADYRARLENRQVPVELAFDYWGRSSQLYHGQAPLLIRPEEPSIRVDLPNPERISAQRIELHLAH